MSISSPDPTPAASETQRPTPFSTAAYDQNQVLKSLRKVEHGLRARFLSISHDANTALRLCQALFPTTRIPLFANARAGSWYVPPVIQDSPTYTAAFKSADGHYGQWSSSLRRPNIHVLQAAIQFGAVVLVDVTRRGKRFPDSFMKTVPIWCAVINNVAALYPCTTCTDANTVCDQCARIHLHPDVPQSERHHIQNKLPQWLADWRRSLPTLKNTVPTLKNASAQRLKPLRPIWVSPESTLWQHGIPLQQLDFTPIVCISASKVVPDGERSFIEPSLVEQVVCGVTFAPRPVGFAYVQGAGDDEEAWCCGLTPSLFWYHHDRLLSIANGSGANEGAMHVEAQLRNEISSILSEPDGVAGNSKHAAFGTADSTIGTRVWSSRILLRRLTRHDLPILLRSVSSRVGYVIVLGVDEQPPPASTEKLDDANTRPTETPKHVDWMPLVDKKGKLDFKYGFGRALGPCLSRLREYCVDMRKDVLICSTDKKGDWCAGLAIAWLAWHCESHDRHQCVEDGELSDHAGYTVRLPRKETIGFVDKETVHNTMLHFTCKFPQFELSRATLKQLNRFFSSPTPSSALTNSP
ncbi:tRNA A64-2'-O-ribosylphosphate transferase [Gracilariopsis chorda]|uniref:tRNA A64-2'-O-ribosylphosphate transferase n=1 Tax=Gracilariopsis chorda TaxID=448386 RepID=A0A2V3IY84_9FLOR|nr:tRNA A64-2'-O-ribosylphosphate transferase [Gracilariopsis chorda]|eukprot:PXF47116.1 tRNA A64-2'-O-ribosylphosphate transferase [Gracilariopsis chorda]